MRVTGFLRATVGRRIALLFFLCALVPIALFSGIAVFTARGQLTEQTHERLRLLAKETSQALVFRLRAGSSEAARFVQSADAPDPRAPIPRWIEHVAWLDDVRSPPATQVDGRRFPVIDDPGDLAHLRSGAPLLRIVDDETLILRVGPDGERGVWVVLDPAYVRGEIHPWDPGAPRSTLPAGLEACALGAATAWLCPDAARDAVRSHAGGSESLSGDRSLRWVDERGTRIAARNTVFLGHSFRAPNWEIVLSDSARSAYGDVHDFERMFLLAAVLSLLVVPFLSQVQIRRNLEPLAALKEGTRRISEREFDSRVVIESGDEFESLGAAFNTMAQQLGRQFGVLTTASEIDRAILGELDSEAIVRTVLERGRETLPGGEIAVLELDETGVVRLRRLDEDQRIALSRAGTAEIRVACEAPGGIRGVPPELEVSLDEDYSWWLVPVRVDGNRPIGLLVGSAALTLGEDDTKHVAQLADRLAVALSNAALVAELERLNVETIGAFARAIDAKSTWTAGHSERVTTMALRLGRELRLSEEHLDHLRRGALVHDVGKIGVPGAILDKPGPLTDEEFDLMRAHTTIGAAILEPITRFRDIVPIVRHHHERFDGGGYPDGLAGDDIPFLARVAAVADVYDALRSARPYRDAMPLARVASIIVADSGTAFDPDVVAAFERVLAAEEQSGTRQGAA